MVTQNTHYIVLATVCPLYPLHLSTCRGLTFIMFCTIRTVTSQPWTFYLFLLQLWREWPWYKETLVCIPILQLSNLTVQIEALDLHYLHHTFVLLYSKTLVCYVYLQPIEHYLATCTNTLVYSITYRAKIKGAIGILVLQISPNDQIYAVSITC